MVGHSLVRSFDSRQKATGFNKRSGAYLRAIQVKNKAFVVVPQHSVFHKHILNVYIQIRCINTPTDYNQGFLSFRILARLLLLNRWCGRLDYNQVKGTNTSNLNINRSPVINHWDGSRFLDSFSSELNFVTHRG